MKSIIAFSALSLLNSAFGIQQDTYYVEAKIKGTYFAVSDEKHHVAFRKSKFADPKGSVHVGQNVIIHVNDKDEVIIVEPIKQQDK